MSFMMRGSRQELEKRIAEWEERGVYPVTDIVTNTSYARKVTERHKKKEINVAHTEKCSVRMEYEDKRRVKA